MSLVSLAVKCVGGYVGTEIGARIGDYISSAVFDDYCKIEDIKKGKTMSTKQIVLTSVVSSTGTYLGYKLASAGYDYFTNDSVESEEFVDDSNNEVIQALLG